MIRVGVISLLLAAPALAQMPDGPVMAPSGFDVTLHEVMYEEQPYSGEMLVIVRLLAPAIASPVLAANLQGDMEWACETWGLPAADALASDADRIVVELMAAPVPRGEAAPETRQFFETYSIEDASCMWELY